MIITHLLLIFLLLLGSISTQLPEEENKHQIDIKVTPEKQTIILLGKKKSINVYCSEQLSGEFCVKASLVENRTQYPIRILSDDSFFQTNVSDIGASHASVEVLGLRPGNYVYYFFLYLKWVKCGYKV